MPTPAVIPSSPFVPGTAQPPYSPVENSMGAELHQLGWTALRPMVDVEPYGSGDLGPDPSDDEPPSMTSASPSEDDDPEDSENLSGKKKKKKRKTKRHEGRRSQEAKAIATSKIVVNLPDFTRQDLREFAENFGRFLKMTGQIRASGRMKCDLLLQCCKTKFLEKQVKQIVTKSATFADVLVALERQYPSYETDPSIRAEIQNLAAWPNNPKPARTSELLADYDHWVGRLTPGSYGSDELLCWLVANIPREVWDECRATERKARAPTYEDLSVLVIKLALEKECDHYLTAYRPGGGGSGSQGRGYQGPRPGQGTTPKNARFMSNVQDTLWCDARDEQGCLVHARDCDQRNSFVVQGKKQETNIGSKPRCRTTTGAQSPVRSAGRGSTTRTSANLGNVFRRSSRPRTAVAGAVARATPTRTVARAGPRAMAKARAARAKVDEEALTANRTVTRIRTSPERTQILHQRGALSPLVGNQTWELRPVTRRKPNKSKGLSVPTKMGGTSQTPANALGDLQIWCSGYVSVSREENTLGYWILGPLYLLWPANFTAQGPEDHQA